MHSHRILPVLCAAALAASPASASISPAAGFVTHTVAAAPGGAFVGGMDFLPNGHVALFDGSSIVELDPATGGLVGTLYTPSGFVYGSFVAVAPSGAFLLFGNSTDNQIVKVPLQGGGGPVVVATIPYNFDLAFRSDGYAYVSAAPSFGLNQLLQLDIGSGATDLIADFVGASGPVAVDATGALYYAEASASFPAPPGQQRILKYDAAQVAGAIGPTYLTAADAMVLIPGVTTVADMLIDEEGDVIVSSDPSGMFGNIFIQEFAPDGTAKGLIGETLQFHFAGTLAFRGNGTAAPSAFGPFQPSSGGTLAALTTDFFSYNDLDLIEPRRATLATTPASPVPVGSFFFDLTAGPPGGYGLFFVAGAPGPELPVFSGGVPFLFDIAPGSIATIALLPLQQDGSFQTQLVNHGGPGTAFIQAALLTSGGQGVGTTTALALALQ